MRADFAQKSHKAIAQFCVHTLIAISIVFLNSPIITYDGWQYISSGTSLLDGSAVSNYFFVRQPLYPLFIGISLEIFNSLWTVVVFQTLICSFALEFFFNSLFKYSNLRFIGRIQLVKSSSILLIWCFLGSYPSFILAQNLFLPIVLIFMSFHLRDTFKYESKDFSKNKIREEYGTVLIIILSFLLAKELFVILFLFRIFSLFISKKMYRFRILQTILTLLIVLTFHMVSNVIINSLERDPRFNVENQEDIFQQTNLREALVKRIKSDPPYSQTMVYAALANLDLVPTMGWDGITSSRYSTPGHPMRLFGLNHILQSSPKCNYFPASGVIAVRKDYVDKYSGCYRTFIRVPELFKSLYYVSYLAIWPLLVMMYLRSLLMGRNLQIALFPFLFVGFYSIIGAGISRYGAPIYPLIIIIAMCEISKIQLKRRKSRK